jgi:hypothetical protein
MVDRKSLQRWSYALVGIGGGIAFVCLPQLLFPAARPIGDPAFAAARLASVVLGIAWAGYFALQGFRRADEYNRERSKFAWYWGSLIGIVPCVPIVALAHLIGLSPVVAAASSDHGQFRAFAAGVTLPILAQLLGFGLVSLWWRIRR